MSDAAIAGLIWLGVFAFMVVAELATVGLTAIWFAGGAIFASIAGFLGLGWPWMLVIFMATSLVLLIVMRPLAKKMMMPKLTATNAESLIGQFYPLIQKAGPGHQTGQVKIGDVEWRVISEDGSEIPEGAVVEVRKIEGTKLIVMPKM